jgi:hypothetical protein
MGGRRALRRALPATAAVVALTLVASCSGGADDPSSQPPPGSDSTSPVGDGTSADPAVDAGHAVDPPGPREGVYGPPDLMVVSPKSLDKKTIAAIAKVKGVTSVETISLSESVIENEAISVAAVDPASYRNYVSSFPTAQTDEIWGRVASGELGLKSQRKDDLPLDKEGYLKLGGAADAPRVHVGAVSAQAPLIDAVVNDTWVETLGMTPDNALLIRTAGTAPKRVRKPIEQILGKSASVQLVDLATRRGIDPTVKQIAVVTGTVADAVGIYRYSVLGGGHIAPEAAWVRTHIATEQVPILGTVTCNKAMLPQLRAALEEVVATDLADEIHPNEYAGCYYPRFIAGSTKLSNHAFGLALDLNTPGNQRGTVGQMHRGVVAIFESWGFTWGGRWGYTDPMHFEMNKIVDPTVVSSRQ